MAVVQLRRIQPPAQLDGGVTHAQAMEMGRRFHTDEFCQAAPTIAAVMGIEFKTVCSVLDGKLWPELRQQWMNKVFP